MLRSWTAVYERPAEYVDHPVFTTRLYVRAETHGEAVRLADQVFEQVYGRTPAAAGFVQLIVRAAVMQ